MLTPAQSRAGRALLDWSLADLSQACGLSIHALSRFERGLRDMRVDNQGRVARAFSEAGVRLINNRTGIGAVLRSAPAEA